MAVELGALKLGRIAIDGSKLKANASKHKAMSYKRMKEEQKRLKQEVRRLLEEAERIDAEEDARYGRTVMETKFRLNSNDGKNDCNGYAKPSAPLEARVRKKPRPQRRNRTAREASRTLSRRRKTSTTSPIRNRAS